MARIGIVCDSTCDLGPAWLSDHDVTMVPLKVTFGDTTYLDWVELQPDRFYELLAAAPELPKTSQPSPADFAAVYRALHDRGCEGIVSIHLSGAVSGTMESAIMACDMVDVPVRVVDTLSVNLGEGLPLMAAIAARDAGGDLDAVEHAARAIVGTQRILFALDSLEYLVKGGRAGRAQGLAASLLNIKPVLGFAEDGVIAPYKKVKGMKKAVQEIASAVAEAAAGGTVRVGLLHSQAPDLVDALVAAIDSTGIQWEHVTTCGVGAVIGTYAGPRAIGAAFYPVA